MKCTQPFWLPTTNKILKTIRREPWPTSNIKTKILKMKHRELKLSKQNSRQNRKFIKKRWDLLVLYQAVTSISDMKMLKEINYSDWPAWLKWPMTISVYWRRVASKLKISSMMETSTSLTKTSKHSSSKNSEPATINFWQRVSIISRNFSKLWSTLKLWEPLSMVFLGSEYLPTSLWDSFSQLKTVKRKLRTI